MANKGISSKAHNGIGILGWVLFYLGMVAHIALIILYANTLGFITLVSGAALGVLFLRVPFTSRIPRFLQLMFYILLIVISYLVLSLSVEWVGEHIRIPYLPWDSIPNTMSYTGIALFSLPYFRFSFTWLLLWRNLSEKKIRGYEFIFLLIFFLTLLFFEHDVIHFLNGMIR